MSGRGWRLGWGLLGVGASTVLLALFLRMEAPWVALGWVALVPWLVALERAGSLREALLAGLALSVGFTLTVLSWFALALQDYTQAPAWVCWLVLVGAAPLFEPQFIAFAAARYLLRRSARVWAALAGALVYVGAEWAWPKLFVDTLGHGSYGSQYLRQGADLAGVHGLTLVLLLANECVLALSPWQRAGARGTLREARAPLALLAALVLGSFLYGYARHRQVTEAMRGAPGLTVGLVQANITHYDRLAAQLGDTYEVVRQVLDTHYALSDELLRSARPDVLVWPETVYPTTFGSPQSEEGSELDREIEDFVSARQVPLVFGAYDSEEGGEYNAAFFLGLLGQGRPEHVSYRKSRLFPLTEWVPEALDSPRLRALLPWTGYWKRGPGPRVVSLRLGGGQLLGVAPLICYDSVFSGHVAASVRQGAELIVTLSNDSWFGDTEGSRLHLVLAAFRSIETRRAQVRATNSGVSALIDPTGEIVARTAVDERAVLAGRVARVAGLSTPVVAWGEWLGPLALALGVALGVGARGARRAHAPPAAPPARGRS